MARRALAADIFARTKVLPKMCTYVQYVNNSRDRVQENFVGHWEDFSGSRNVMRRRQLQEAQLENRGPARKFSVDAPRRKAGNLPQRVSGPPSNYN